MIGLTQEERSVLVRAVITCRQELTLPIAGLGDVHLYWDDEDDPRKATKAAQYQWAGEDRIILSHTWRDQLQDATPWVCHELRHRYQHLMLGWLYPIAAHRLIARWTVEPSAYRVENECLEILGMETGDVA